MKIPVINLSNKYSLYIMVLLLMCIAILRIITLTDNELSWDVFGYYIHLPAAFIYHDHALENINWIHDIMTKYPVTGTLYQLSTGPDWNPIFFFLMGMSFFYSPWFFIGHVLAMNSGYPVDGFSLPYQYSIALGALVYTFIGLIYLRKILLGLFSDKTTSIVLVIIVLATNYLHFMTVKNLETANILFMMVTLITWNTIRWHQDHKLINLLAIAVFTVLTALAKPSEVLVLLIPLLWGVHNDRTIVNKIKEIYQHKTQFLLAMATGLVVALPQMLYWHSETGHFLFDSYKNPGVGLDLASPHIFNVLFSFKKGWLIYTPVMILAIIGFVTLYRKNKGLFTPVLIYSLIAFYILSSWTEWWYGASFSIRPMITLYPLLAIPLGYFIDSVYRRKVLTRIFFTSLIAGFLVLNLFQTWQLNNYIIDPYRMTRAYYFSIFGKSAVSPETRNLLSIDHPLNDDGQFTNEAEYNRRNIGFYNFEEADINRETSYVTDNIGGKSFRLDSIVNFSPEIRTSYNGITNKDHAWIRASVDIFIPSGYNTELPLLILTFERKEGTYGYRAYEIDTSVFKPGQWGSISTDYLTPHIRSGEDFFKIYVWHRGKTAILIDNLKADVFEPRY
ncbi:MAG: hypothetical protein V1775_03215 [Bacteroidota bacterium]